MPTGHSLLYLSSVNESSGILQLSLRDQTRSVWLGYRPALLPTVLEAMRVIAEEEDTDRDKQMDGVCDHNRMCY